MSELKFKPYKFKKPRRIWKRSKAFHIFERKGITYYINASTSVLLNPEKLDGSGILLVKPILEWEPTGVFFSDKPFPTDKETFAAEVAYLYAIGKPRKGYAVVPATMFPGCYDHTPENIKKLRKAGDVFSHV